MQNPKAIIVDENDNPIGLKYRSELDPLQDIYRVSGVWITNSKGEVLIAQRKLTKKKDPGLWSTAVVGTIEEGETYESNAYKESAEELGLQDITLELGPKTFFNSPNKFFGQLFFCKVDKPAKDFVIQEEEVEQIVWINFETLKKDVKENPHKYTPTLPKIIEILK